MKQFLTVLSMAFLISGSAQAQLVGKERINKDLWLLDGKKIEFGQNQAVSLTSDGTSLVVEGGSITTDALEVETLEATTSVSSVTFSDAGTSGVSYNDVNILELRQADLTSTCTLGQIAVDTGGATVELCYCKATDTWFCASIASGPTN